MTRWALRLGIVATGVVAAWLAVRVYRVEPKQVRETNREAGTVIAPRPTHAVGSDAPDTQFVEGTGEAPPDCLGRVYALAQPLRECLHDPWTRDCGIRFAFTRTCEVRQVRPWGKVDDTIRACLVAKVETRRPETPTTPVWFVDYPLGEPAFTTPVDGIGETKWLRRGLPKAPAAMKDVARVALGPRVRSEEEADFTATFEARRYRLRSLGGPLREPYVPAFVALESGGRTQILVHDIWDFRVRWAGDVDKDGRLDLLIESTMTSHALRFDLFLSGKSDGRLVRLAAMDADEGD